MGGMETQYSQNSHACISNSQLGGYSQLQNFSLRSESSESLPAGPALGRRAPRISRFEGQQGLCMRELEGCRKQSLLLFFFFSCAHNIQKFPGHGLNPHHRSNQSHRSKNDRSLIHWATRELLKHTPLLKGTWKKSHPLHVSAERQQCERRLSQIHLLNLETLPEMQQANGAHPGSTDTWT